MKRHAIAVWRGNLKDGGGTLSTPASGLFTDVPYSFHTRFANEDGKQGTNPEELIAAAHAGCFAMQLSAYLAEAGHPPEQLTARAEVTLVPGTGITGSHLIVEAGVPQMAQSDFLAQAERAKNECPVSKALCAIEVTMQATLSG